VANPAACTMFGYSTEEFTRLSVADLHPKESLQQIMGEFEAHSRGEKSLSTEIPCLRKDGTVFYANINAAPVIINGRPCMTGFFTDVTEHKQMEEEHQKAERLDSIGTLAGGIAHDFNNLLTGILGNITLAKRHVESGGKAFERLDEAEKASLRARDLTQQLLTFSRGGLPIKQVMYLGGLIRDSVTFALRGYGVKPEFSLPDDMWAVEADEGQINQVILNITKNADEAMPYYIIQILQMLPYCIIF